MMRMIYANAWKGDTLFGRLSHKYSITTPSADAVRNRRPLITQELRQRAAQFDSAKPLALLSIACGPANEIADIFKTKSDLNRFKITLLDQDADALQESQLNKDSAEKTGGTKADVRYGKQSTGGLLRGDKAKQALGRYDFIYSMGLYNYLDAATAKKLTGTLFSMLNPNGTLLLGNYSKANQIDAAGHASKGGIPGSNSVSSGN